MVTSSNLISTESYCLVLASCCLLFYSNKNVKHTFLWFLLSISDRRQLCIANHLYWVFEGKEKGSSTLDSQLKITWWHSSSQSLLTIFLPPGISHRLFLHFGQLLLVDLFALLSRPLHRLLFLDTLILSFLQIMFRSLQLLCNAKQFSFLLVLFFCLKDHILRLPFYYQNDSLVFFLRE